MKQYDLLDFDEKLFGFKVARLTISHYASDSLTTILNELRTAGVRLVYWASDANDQSSQEAAIVNQGLLVDHKVTFHLSLADQDETSLFSARELVEERPLPEANHEMKEMAYSIGRLSRFGRDPNLPDELMKKMYGEWINNSVKRIAAKKVLVAQSQGHIAGMVTLCEKQGRGDIGLIAVGEQFQGIGLGKILVRAALAEFIAMGYNEAQVVTQQENKPACSLYESVGFKLEKLEHFYHFWL